MMKSKLNLKQKIILQVLLALAIATTDLLAIAKPVVPPKGGAAILLKDPVWLTGIASATAIYSESFPQPAKTEHLEVVNAGFWLANQSKPSQLFYELTLRITKPFEKRVFTRVVLADPENMTKPITYEHNLDPKEKSTKATHGPLSQVTSGAKYSMTFEIFSDETRTEPIEKITQEIISPVDNTDGCVVLTNELKLLLFPNMKNLMAEKNIPIEKISLACDR